MNCREAQPQIFAERDGALDTVQRAALDGHLAQCDACRRVRENLASAVSAWRIEAVNVRVPDAEREWQAVRRRIRGGAESSAERTARPRRNVFAWIALPLGAAAALAVTFFVIRNPSGAGADVPVHLARTNSVDIPGGNATTMVFVDEKSGWLFVLASDTNPKQG
jgi:hypothetical protein